MHIIDVADVEIVVRPTRIGVDEPCAVVPLYPVARTHYNWSAIAR
jgi:hypothetical protein